MRQRISRKRVVIGAASLLCALTAIGVFPSLLCLDEAVTHSAVMLALLLLLTFMGHGLLRVAERRLKAFSLGFGFCFALCQLAGARLDAAGTLGGGWAALGLLLAACACSPAAGFLFASLARLCARYAVESPSPVSPGTTRKCFGAALAVILLCWLPYYLAYFPGMFNYDSAGEAAQFLAGTYDGSFPPFHTLLLAGFYRLGQALGSPNAGIALYTSLQAGVLAAAMAAAVAVLNERGCRRFVLAGMTACFALLPFFPLLAMSTTKDIFFSAALLFWLLALYEGRADQALWKKPSFLARIVLLTALVCLLRQNGIAAAAAALIAGLCLGGAGRKRLAAALLCGLLLFGGAQLGMNQAMKPAPRGIREALSVPLNQVARVYALAQEQNVALPEEEELLAFIPDANRYQRHLADGVKRHATVGVSNMPEFLSLYGRLLARHPAAFADGWAYLTKGYWHLDDVTHLDVYAERGGHGYMETACQEGYGVTRQSLWPELEAALDRLYVENEYKGIPLLSALMEPALWCWLVWTGLWMAVYRKNKTVIFLESTLIGLYLTLLFGPCAYMRYAFPLALCALPLGALCLTEKSAVPVEKAANKTASRAKRLTDATPSADVSLHFSGKAKERL